MTSARLSLVTLLFEKARCLWPQVRSEQPWDGAPISNCLCSYPDGELAAHWNEWRAAQQKFEKRFRDTVVALIDESTAAEVAWNLEIPVGAVVNIWRQEVIRELKHPSPLVEEQLDYPIEKPTDV